MKLGLQLHVNGSKALDKKHCLYIDILSQTVSDFVQLHITLVLRISGTGRRFGACDAAWS